ncbi:MAG: cyanophycinase [Candidatus Sericytochromatia bacterium]
MLFQFLASLLFSALSLNLLSVPPPAVGPLVIIGGGPVPEGILQRVISLAGGPDAPLVIVPQASEFPQEAAQRTLEQFRAAGARRAEAYQCQAPRLDEPACLQQLERAGGVFFTGGDQNRLAAAFAKTEAFEKIRTLHAQGRVLAGTSAGAAVMSQVMLTGNVSGQPPSTDPDPQGDAVKAIQHGQVLTTSGFGFVTRLVIDQHFLRRQRQNRLLSVVLEHPHLVGVGIDESTAVLVRPDQSFEVLGSGAVMVFDARRTRPTPDAQGHFSVRDVRLHLLTAGQVFD